MAIQRFNPKVSMVGRSGITPLSKSLRMSVKDKFGNTMTKTEFEKFVRSDPKLKVLARRSGTVESWKGEQHVSAFFKKVHGQKDRYVIAPKVKRALVYKGNVSDIGTKKFYLNVKKEEVKATTPQGPTPAEKAKELKMQKIKEGWKRLRQYERADQVRKQPNLGDVGASTSAVEAQREKQLGQKGGSKEPQKQQPVSAPMPFAGTSIHSQTRPAHAPDLHPQIVAPHENTPSPNPQNERVVTPEPPSPKDDANTQNDESNDVPTNVPPIDPDIG